jgi:hypothetical protein
LAVSDQTPASLWTVTKRLRARLESQLNKNVSDRLK